MPKRAAWCRNCAFYPVKISNFNLSIKNANSNETATTRAKTRLQQRRKRSRKPQSKSTKTDSTTQAAADTDTTLYLLVNCLSAALHGNETATTRAKTRLQQRRKRSRKPKAKHQERQQPKARPTEKTDTTNRPVNCLFAALDSTETQQGQLFEVFPNLSALAEHRASNADGRTGVFVLFGENTSFLNIFVHWGIVGRLGHGGVV